MIEKQITPSSMNVIHRFDFWSKIWKTLPHLRQKFIRELQYPNHDGKHWSSSEEAIKILFLAVKIEYPKFDELVKACNTEENAKNFLYIFNEKQQFYKYVSDNDWLILKTLKAYEDI